MPTALQDIISNYNLQIILEHYNLLFDKAPFYGKYTWSGAIRLLESIRKRKNSRNSSKMNRHEYLGNGGPTLCVRSIGDTLQRVFLTLLFVSSTQLNSCLGILSR